MRRLEEYVSAGGRLLRCGYTTGTCAAAATYAATSLLLSGSAPDVVSVRVPAGVDVLVDVEESRRETGEACCAVRKDAGDDADVTDGVTVWARVSRTAGHDVAVEGGEGVGRVTLPGLDQPVGEAAINSVPRQMIRTAATDAAAACAYAGGLRVVIAIPQGTELARRTFNPRLGIRGGISVLGTSGIVRPMSEDALVSSIQLELRVLRERGDADALVVPGNYGAAFAAGELGASAERAVMCSNYLGATIDEAARLGFASLLVVGHVGKLAKVAAGVMNMHSRVADGRAEVMAAHAALAGAPREAVARIMDAPTTDAMLVVLEEHGVRDEALASLMAAIGRQLTRRAGGGPRVEAVVFSNAHGLLGKTAGADALVALHARGGRKT